jgi:hypothetical protein
MELRNAIYKVVEDKTITWFENTNEYLVLENTTADILKRLSKGISVKDIALSLSKKINVPLEKAENFIVHLKKEVYDPNHLEKEQIINDYRDIKKPKVYEFIKFYKINDVVFKVSFLSENELSFIHPKFAHLVVDEVETYQNEFEVFINTKFIFLYVNDKCIGSWGYNDVHYFQGKFSMELIQKIHQKEEDEWLGVFHASAISDGKKSMLFLGDSGNGKSTSLALLQANGFTCLADDFVPMDAKKQEVYSFPASISIKKNSLETLLPIYPELKTSAEYHFKRLNKIVRYLKPNNTNFYTHLPCNDLVFIKYQKGSELICNKINKLDAFLQLIPDSWLSPKKENAQIFLDWFSGLNCYQLTYSENDKMIAKVSEIFKNDSN